MMVRLDSDELFNHAVLVPRAAPLAARVEAINVSRLQLQKLARPVL